MSTDHTNGTRNRRERTLNAAGRTHLLGKIQRDPYLHSVSFLMKANASLCRRRRRGHELPNGLEDRPEVLVVLAQLAFEIVKLASQIFVGGHDFTQPHKRPHDGNVHLDGPVAFLARSTAWPRPAR